MNLIKSITADKKLNAVLLQECNIYFYTQLQETRFTENHESRITKFIRYFVRRLHKMTAVESMSS